MFPTSETKFEGSCTSQEAHIRCVGSECLQECKFSFRGRFEEKEEVRITTRLLYAAIYILNIVLSSSDVVLQLSVLFDTLYTSYYDIASHST